MEVFIHMAIKQNFSLKTHPKKNRARILREDEDVAKSTFPPTSFRTLTLISLQSSSRLTTSNCPFHEAIISAVFPSYIFFCLTIKQNFSLKKTTSKKEQGENLISKFWKMKKRKFDVCFSDFFSFLSGASLFISAREVYSDAEAWQTASRAEIKRLASCQRGKKKI